MINTDAAAKKAIARLEKMLDGPETGLALEAAREILRFDSNNR